MRPRHKRRWRLRTEAIGRSNRLPIGGAVSIGWPLLVAVIHHANHGCDTSIQCPIPTIHEGLPIPIMKRGLDRCQTTLLRITVSLVNVR
jgi:hypothetical protein